MEAPEGQVAQVRRAPAKPYRAPGPGRPVAPPLAFLARFPFLPAAAEYVGRHGPTLEELLRERAYERARERGLARVRGALAESRIEDTPLATEPEAVLELLSYGVARMVTAALRMPYAARRCAVAEAKLAHARLLREEPGAIAEVASMLGFRVRDGALHVADYLRHTAPIKEPGWKLVNQPLRKGFVELEPRRLARVVQEAVRMRVEAASLREPAPEAEAAFRPELAALRRLAEEHLARFQGESLGPVRLEMLPPCMARLLAQLQGGVNVPHTGRFALTSFLHTVGMANEEIMRLFAAAPDFKEEMTRYQVEHITGKTSGTEYTPPSCATLVTYGLCPMEELRKEQRDRFCVHPKMTHPLTYYRWKSRDAKRDARARVGEVQAGATAGEPSSPPRGP